MTSLTNRLTPQGWIEIIQMRVQSLADLLQRRHEPDQHGDLDRQIDEARWNIVAAVQQMPPPQHGEQAERPCKPVYTPEDLAEAWGCTTRHVRRLADEGQLRAFRVGKLYRFTAAAVQEFERQATAGQSPK
jgi:excisionase family DNA binding protein